jgi:hypothetical protein
MPTRTRRTVAAATPSNAVKAERGRRVSLGTAFATSNEDFFSGPIQGQRENYLNQSELLNLLGPAPEGHAWRIKLFVREAKGKTLVDCVAEIEPLQAR